MKIRKLIKKLMKQDGRIPLIAQGTNGVERNISRDFVNDGPDWETFSLKLGGRYKAMDTDYCKFAIDYSMADPDIKPSIYSGNRLFEDYKLNVIWQENKGCWFPAGVKKIRIEKRRFAGNSWKTRAMVLILDGEIPDYVEDDPIFENIPEDTTGPDEDAAYSEEMVFGKGDRITFNIHGVKRTEVDSENEVPEIVYEIDPTEDGKRQFITGEYLTGLIEHGASLYHVKEIKAEE